MSISACVADESTVETSAAISIKPCVAADSTPATITGSPLSTAPALFVAVVPFITLSIVSALSFKSLALALGTAFPVLKTVNIILHQNHKYVGRSLP